MSSENDDVSKNVTYYLRRIFKKFLSYLVCVPGFKSINNSSLSRMVEIVSPPPLVSDYEVKIHR